MLQHILASMNGHTSATKETRNPPASSDASPDPGGESEDYRLEALNRILSSGHFRASERNKRFLKFVVEETVAGRAERIKAFTVAVDVFGRDSTFDASVDPIVRIAAGHLRRSLANYYESYGRNEPVRIRLPLGTYVPTFEKRENMAQRTAGQLRRLVADRQRRLQSGAVGVVMALSAGVAALGYVSLDVTGGPVDRTPLLVVDSARTHAQGTVVHSIADLFTESLWIALNKDAAIRVVGVRPDEDLDDVLSETRQRFGSKVPIYQLITAVRLENGELHVYWHVLDGRSNETYISASAVEVLMPGSRETAPTAIAGEVADSLKRLTAKANGKTPAPDSASEETSQVTQEK